MTLTSCRKKRLAFKINSEKDWTKIVLFYKFTMTLQDARAACEGEPYVSFFMGDDLRISTKQAFEDRGFILFESLKEIVF